MPQTPRGYISYPLEGDTAWYSGSDGLEEWLARAELLGIPTYDTFSDLPSAGTTKTLNPSIGKTQRQFAAVAGEQAIYRDDGSQWVRWLSPDPENRELMGTASDADNTTNFDLTISDTGGYEYVELQCDIQGNASSATYSIFIQLNGDTGTNYEYNSLDSGSVTTTTGAARFSSQMWGANTERHRFAISAGSGQNHISQVVGSAENRRFLLNGDQTSTAADGPITDIRVYGNFNAAADIYGIAPTGP